MPKLCYETPTVPEIAKFQPALLHYEAICDSTPTTPEERVELRRKFAEINKHVKRNRKRDVQSLELLFEGAFAYSRRSP